MKLRCDHFVCIPTIQINFIFISVTGKDELDKLVCPQNMGLHSSGSNPVEAPIFFFFPAKINCDYNCYDHISISLNFLQFPLL